MSFRGASLLLGAVLFVSTLPPVSEAQSLPDNPLSPCPDTPNCERTARAFDVPADTLYRAAERALESLSPASLRRPGSPSDSRLAAVYRVALIFKDDVDVVVRARDDGGSVLYVRSASRVGYDDLGVNRRRVERLWEAMETALHNDSP